MATVEQAQGLTAYTYDFPVGTERVDLSGKEETVRYPMPDDNPNDPLTWTMRRKVLTFAVGMWYTFMTTMPIQAFNSIYPTLIDEFGVTPTDISLSTGYANLAIALGAFAIGPACNAFGRRSMLFGSNLLSIAALVWLAKSTTFNQFQWSRNLEGFGAAAIETISITLVGDLFFTAEAGLFHALGLIPLIIATYMGSPVLAAFIQRGWSWRSFVWMNVGFTIATQLLIFFFLPETLWPRTAESARGIAVTVAPHSNSISDEEAETDSQKQNGGAVVFEADQKEVVGLVGRGAPSKQQKYSLLPSLNRSYNPLTQLKNILVLCTFTPVIVANMYWVAIGGGSVAFGFLTSGIWYAPPYNFSPSQVGLTALANILGGLVGLLLVGPISDWDLARRTRNNGGVREAEMRLWVAVYGGVLTIITLVIYGLSIERQWHYLIVLIPGMTAFSAVSVLPVVAGINYATDTYKAYGLEISFSMSLTSGIWVFGTGYFLNTLFEERGAFVCVMLVSIPIFVTVAGTIVLLFCGKSLRRLTSNSSLLR